MITCILERLRGRPWISFSALAFILIASSFSLAADKKISSDVQGGNGGPPLGVDDHRAEVTVHPTDGTQRIDSRNIKAQALDAGSTKGVLSNAMYLTCGITTVHLSHGAITVSQDTNTQMGYFDYTPVTFNLTDVASIAPPITTTPVWCELVIPQDGGSTWHFPNAIRLDESLPDITTAANFVTYPLIPLADGKVRWSWIFSDSGTPGDPDGDVTTCPTGDHQCNKSDSRYQYQFYAKKYTDLDYPLAPTGSSGPSGTTSDFLESFGTSDNFMVNGADSLYCFTARAEDTAGNFSPKATGPDVKCFVPDGKKPVFKSVHYYTDAAFTKEFPKDSMGNYTITSNPCKFYPGTCDRDMGHPRYIYLKLVFSEPLFDGQFWGGYTKRVNDGIDNDSDGLIDEEGAGFDGIDNDGDGFIDEDVKMTTASPCVPSANVVNDGKDNDCDGYVDEEPNSSNGKDDDGDGRTDEDTSSTFCANKYLNNTALGTCFTSPRITIAGPDIEGFVPGAAGTNNYNDLITWQCTAYAGNTNPLCTGYATGTTIYSYRWEVTGMNNSPVGLVEGIYEVSMVQAMDAVGNVMTTLTPQSGGNTNLDNSGPAITVSYFKNNTYTTGIPNNDHDGSDEATHPCGALSADTAKMSNVKEGKLYYQITVAETAGATPTVAMYFPDSQTPSYCGIPQGGSIAAQTVYTTCNQPVSCDPCTGSNCIAYNPETDPCAVFRGCYEVASTTVNNGYIGIGVYATDRLSNSLWDPTDAAAAASQVDSDGLSDDTNGDGYPTYIPGTLEPDGSVTSGQYFAVDTNPPSPPALSLPITPCNGTIARTGPTCDPASSPTTRSPTFTWTRLTNSLDDDGNNGIDEETYDGIDNDGDGFIDEDAVAPATGTMAWEIRAWHLQIATSTDFATASMIIDDSLVEQANTIVSNLEERTASAPYYWRVSAYDHAGNEGDFSPPSGAYSFGIDITPPQISVKYYSDSARTTELVRNDDNIPVTADTASQGTKIYLTLTSDTPVQATPTYKIRQAGQILLNNSTTKNPANPNLEFFTEFEVDALGSGQIFSDGLADVLISVSDLYGNALSDSAPATGAQFFVDTTAPYISPGDITVSPNPASMDNDGDGMPGELVEDAVTIRVQASEYLRSPFVLRVKQANFPEVPTVDDQVDNDCDGRIDEDALDGIDNDIDGRIDEDTGTHGMIPGSGCMVTMTREASVPGLYTGKYNVFASYDGKAQILIGADSSSSPYWAGDYAGNSVRATAEFTVDTTPPDAPSLVLPLHDQHVQDNTPTLGWQVLSRAPDLWQYRVQLASNQSFSPTIVDAIQADDGLSTTFYYTVPTELALADGKYYWRAYVVDTAKNRSVASVVSSFYVDTQPPSPPKFSAVQTPTVETTSSLAGTAEANSSVEIYVNGLLVGEVQSNAAGAFTVGIDDDKDGQIDEDIVDSSDNDLDGSVDEDPAGIFLAEGDNIIEGRVIDSAGNIGTRGCDPTTPTPFYVPASQQCIITRDSGAPTFKVLYYSDSGLTTPLPFNSVTNRFQAKEGTVYMKIIASEDLPAPPTYSINQQGTTDVANQASTSISGSPRNFTGSYAVHKNNGASYLDGDATIIVIGTDSQGNKTPDGTLPSVGAIFNIDTTPSTYKLSYYKDSAFSERLTLDENLRPNAKAGNIYLRIDASEAQSTPPKLSIDQQGTSDIVEAQSTGVRLSYGTSTTLFSYTYSVHSDDGSSYIDGDANVVFTGTDLAGNQIIAAEPTSGMYFVIDTTAPDPPALVLPATTTLFTQIDVTGTSENLSYVEIYVRANRDMEIDDEKDNDGDGNIDEESADGIDNDNDLFIDEDTTANICTAGKYWSFSSHTCATALPLSRSPNGTATTSLFGAFSTTVTGIYMGKNILTARAKDFAGNISQFSPNIDLYNNSPENINLTHEFGAGWNLVGIPMQPSITNPNTVLGGEGGIYRLQNGIYKTDLELQPMEPGACYWVNYGDDGGGVTIWGITSTTRTIRLTRGWNMIGIPYDKNVKWDAGIIVKVENKEYTLGTDDANEILEPLVYFFDSPTSDFQPGKTISDNITLEPWKGFLVKALTDCYIQFPIP